MGFLAIGNGEKCRFCDKVMNNNKIDGKDSFEHLIENHPVEFEAHMFGEIDKEDLDEDETEIAVRVNPDETLFTNESWAKNKNSGWGYKKK